ncbi:MAG: DUF2878 domain-containing protein [Planctomycetota bacterium]|nr:DUF2878 domain-containing protein [Planctomycetota bacterium]
MKPLHRNLADFALLQIGWFAAVLGGAAGVAWLGPLTAALFIAIHVRWVVPAAWRRDELRNVLVWGTVGCVLDVGQVAFGVLRFEDPAWTIAGVPAWLASLWFLFPICFNTCFAWLHRRLAVAALLAFVGAPLSYQAGVALEALTVDESLVFGALGGAWAIYLPVALVMTRRPPED